MYAIRSYYAFAPAWDSSQSLGTKGVDYDFDTNAGQGRLNTLTASGMALLNGPQAVSAADVNTFFIVITSYSIHYTKLYEASRCYGNSSARAWRTGNTTPTWSRGGCGRDDAST